MLLITNKPAITPPVSTTKPIDVARVSVSPTTVSSEQPLGDTPPVVSDKPLDTSSIVHPPASEERLITS